MSSILCEERRFYNMLNIIKHCTFKLGTCYLIAYQLQYPGELFPVGIDDVGLDVTGGDGATGAYVGFSVGVEVGF